MQQGIKRKHSGKDTPQNKKQRLESDIEEILNLEDIPATCVETSEGEASPVESLLALNIQKGSDLGATGKGKKRKAEDTIDDHSAKRTNRSASPSRTPIHPLPICNNIKIFTLMDTLLGAVFLKGINL